MKQRIIIILVFIVAIGVLILINAFAYVRAEDKQDSELAPNRSSYNAQPTGTRAFYDLLNESGFKVMRWREAPEKLLGVNGEKIRTFVIVGRPAQRVEDEEAKALLLWVEQGGDLVLIDRRPEESLLPKSSDWSVTTEFIEYPSFSTDSANQKQMTEGVAPVKPAQPTRLTENVESVSPSRFYSSIKLSSKHEEKKQNIHGQENASSSPAPVVHLTVAGRNILIDYPHGRGHIILLSDPFIVANDGINLNDNLQLAINLVTVRPGVIAFDEFHQGRATTHNAFVNYYSGTPVLAIAGQIALLILLIVWTRSRRFARPLPLPHIDRRSSLEFVASMAELQERTKAFDLAIENVYTRTRRVLARYAGVDYNSSRSEIATRVAARSSIDPHRLETLMKQSEEAINGVALTEKQSIQLVKRLREVESALGLRMRAREIKQSVNL